MLRKLFVSSRRQWNIVLHRHDDASFSVRVWVDGKVLLPACAACSAAAALAYVEEALVDVREDDQLAVRAQSAGGIRSVRPSSAAAALRWLAERVLAETSEAAQPGTSTRRILRPAPPVKPGSQAS